MASEAPGVELLGPVSIRNGDGLVSGNALGGRRGRVVLVALALADQPIAGERLAAMVWADDPPATWTVALRGIVSGIRSAASTIGLGEQRLIETTASGYALAQGIDVDVRDESIREAEQLLEQERFAAALQAVERAALREGAALLPGEDLDWLLPHRERLDRDRLRALEITAEAAGRTGDEFRAVAAARTAVAVAPLDERAHRTLIVALDRAGDRAAAVSAYEKCRSLLADQLGVDPSKETVDVYLAALRRPVRRTGRRRGCRRSSRRSSAARARPTSSARPSASPGWSPSSARAASASRGWPSRSPVLPRYFDGGRFWVPLTAVAEDELVASSVALALGSRVGADDPAATLTEHLAPLGPALLVLDGCELVADGVAELVHALLGGCPTLTVLVTSRTALRLPASRCVLARAAPRARRRDDPVSGAGQRGRPAACRPGTRRRRRPDHRRRAPHR